MNQESRKAGIQTKNIWAWNMVFCLVLAILPLAYRELAWIAYLGWFACATVCLFLHLLEIALRKLF